MPSPHPTNRPPAGGPTPKQLQLLRRLAHASGQTFTTPRTKAQASREIQRLAEIINNTPIDELVAERLHEPERLRDSGPRDGTAIQSSEITGYGANARWKHRHQDRGGRVMSTAGTQHELARYHLPDGTQRALIAQRINGRVAIRDTPTSEHDSGRVYLVERHIESQDAMRALAAEYVDQSLQRGEPAILVPADIALRR